MNNKIIIFKYYLIITTQIINIGVVEYHPAFMKGSFIMIYEFKATEDDFISTIEEWIEKHATDFSRVESSEEIRFTNSKGEFVTYKVENGDRSVEIGNLDTENWWLCLWDTIDETFYYREDFSCMPHMALTPYVVELIKMFSERFIIFHD